MMTLLLMLLKQMRSFFRVTCSKKDLQRAEVIKPMSLIGQHEGLSSTSDVLERHDYCELQRRPDNRMAIGLLNMLNLL
jgi:hypothetical protein